MDVRKFGQTKELDPQSDRPTPKMRLGVEAQVFLPRVGRIQMDNGGCRAQDPHGGEDTEKEIPGGQGPSPMPSFLFGKVSPTGKDAHGVQEAGGNGNPRMHGHPIADGDGVIGQLKAVSISIDRSISMKNGTGSKCLKSYVRKPMNERIMPISFVVILL